MTLTLLVYRAKPNACNSMDKRTLNEESKSHQVSTLNKIDAPPSPKKQHGQEGAFSTIDSLQSMVTKDGILNDNINVDKYAEIMANETNHPQRILLLKIVVASLHQHPQLSERYMLVAEFINISCRLVSSELFLSIMYEWISKIDVDMAISSQLVLKALEILAELQLSLDQLVRYKFGRVIKKITQKFQDSKKDANLYSDRIEILAKQLFERWSSLATQNDTITIPKKRSIDETPVVQIAEAPGQEVGLKPPKEDEPISKKKRDRKVSFPDDEKELVQIVVFERDPAEYEFLSDGSASQHSYLHADRDEAAKAFKLLKDGLDDDDLKSWYQPEALTLIPERPDGKDCEEKIIQGLRERTVLSVVYYSLHTIPSNPSESIVDEGEQTQEPKIIPSRDSHKATQRTIPLNTAPTLIVPPMLMNIPDPSILSSFLANPSDIGSIFERSTEVKVRDNPPPPNHYRSQTLSSRPPICKYYRPRRPNSCKLGSACGFLHQD